MAYETTDELLAEISDYWDKQPDSNLYKLMDAFNQPLESISDNANKVERWRALSDAKGTTLNLFGSDIATYRPSKDDGNYRFIIHLMELLSRAQGTIPSIYKIASNALKAKSYFRIWKTGIRHIGIQIPFDSIKTVQMQKFLLSSLHKMLALGYWIDGIIFRTSTRLPLHIGVGGQSSWQTTARSKIVWWTGWNAQTNNQAYGGVKGRISNTSIWSANTIWWTGWKARTGNQAYGGVKCRISNTSIWSTNTTLWTKLKTATSFNYHFGIISRYIDSSVWPTETI